MQNVVEHHRAVTQLYPECHHLAAHSRGDSPSLSWEGSVHVITRRCVESGEELHRAGTQLYPECQHLAAHSRGNPIPIDLCPGKVLFI